MREASRKEHGLERLYRTFFGFIKNWFSASLAEWALLYPLLRHYKNSLTFHRSMPGVSALQLMRRF